LRGRRLGNAHEAKLGPVHCGTFCNVPKKG